MGGQSDTGHGTRRAKWRHRAGAVAFGLALLCAGEVALELADYGGPTSIFLTVPEGDGTESYVTNLNAFRSTFAAHPVIRAQGMYPAPPPQRFPVRKPATSAAGRTPGAYRICVMGGSAAMGFPYRINGSFPMFLQSILNTVCEGRTFHVVNVGVSAVGTYSLRERIEEVLGYGTDMVVIYSGHNEFYGAYGAASAIPLSSRRPITLAQLWLRRRRLSMVMADLVAQFAPRPPERALKQHLAQIMPARTDIGYGDETYLRVKASHEANLCDIVRATRRRGTPIVLCTLGANLRDFPPLGSLLPTAFPPESAARWQELVSTAKGLAASGRVEQAAASFQAALELAPGHAETHYRLAQCLDRLGRYREAFAHYDAARNQDTVRWRAGADFNDVIRSVARRAADPDVVLADAAVRLEQEAPDGIPGREFFLEHVHLTLEGNFAIAEAVARAIADSPTGRGLGDWDWTRHKPFGYYATANDIDRLDVISGLQQAALMQHDVLSGSSLDRDNYARLLARTAALEAGLTEAERAAVSEAAAAAGRPEAYDRLYLALAAEHQRRGDLGEALQALRKARRYGYWQLDNERCARLLLGEAVLLLDAGRADGALACARQALACAQQALALAPESVDALLLTARAYRLLGDGENEERWLRRAESAGGRPREELSLQGFIRER